MLTTTAPDSPILSEDEVKALAGGYVRADKQIQVLHQHGYVRAWRSPLTGRVVLERAHAAAVAAGRPSEPDGQNDPQPNWTRA